MMRWEVLGMKDVLGMAMCASVLLLLSVNSNVAAEFIDTQPDTWAAVDGLGRAAPNHDQVGDPRPGKSVGLFYFLWLGQHRTAGPYDITRILATQPEALRRPTTNPWGPEYHFHHWGEPLFGYYIADDAWVLRKHAQMLSDALVDVVIFDVSNQETYPKVYRKLCEVWTQVRRDGGSTPHIAFFAPFGDDSTVLSRLYNELYKAGDFADLWFRWKGKPLILARKKSAPPEMQETFAFRPHGPDYFSGPTGPNQWQWLQIHPQQPYYSDTNKVEQVSVSVAQNASGKRLCAFSEANTYGRSWHDGARDERPDAVLHGLNFAEQWKRALELDPEFIFITGWNEWIAMRLPEFNGVHEPVMFVDQFTQEYSRDVEPMNGGHWDNYYYQMVSGIRRFKGVRPAPAAPRPTTIQIDGDFSDWAGVQPEFRDDRGDTMHRDHPGYDDAGRYVNKTGRNDFVLLKVAADNRTVGFYARTASAITPHTDPNWMLLYINADNDLATGSESYDFRVNRTLRGQTKSVIEKAGTTGTWTAIGEVEYRVSGNELELALPRRTLRPRDDSPLRLGFKWADNIQRDNDVMEFTVSGDTAPNARFQYVFAVK